MGHFTISMYTLTISESKEKWYDIPPHLDKKYDPWLQNMFVKFREQFILQLQVEVT